MVNFTRKNEDAHIFSHIKTITVSLHKGNCLQKPNRSLNEHHGLKFISAGRKKKKQQTLIYEYLKFDFSNFILKRSPNGRLSQFHRVHLQKERLTLKDNMCSFIFFFLRSQRSRQGQIGPAAPITEQKCADYRARWRRWHQQPEIGWLDLVSWRWQRERPARWLTGVKWARGSFGDSGWNFTQGKRAGGH